MNDGNHKNQHEQQDVLNTLWHQQAPVQVNIQNVIKLAKSQQRKQRLYIAIDLLSLLPFLLLFYVDIAFTVFLKTVVFLCWCAGVATVIFFIKLRWEAAFRQYENTVDYCTGMHKQLKNNAVIAKVNKHVGWLAALLTVLISAIHGYYVGIPAERLTNNVVLVALICVAFLIPWLLWTSKRQQRFEKEAKQFEAIFTDVSGARE